MSLYNAAAFCVGEKTQTFQDNSDAFGGESGIIGGSPMFRKLADLQAPLLALP